MLKKSDPWYVHAALYLVIAVLAYLLIQVSIVQPSRIIKVETFNKTESRARMLNIRQAEIIWEKKYGKYTDRMDSLVSFIKTDSALISLMTGVDTITGKSTNPFIDLAVGAFVPDSLFNTPKTVRPYVLKVDTLISIDSVNNARGRFLRMDTTISIGKHYFVNCPDGYGSIGDTSYTEAMKNTASWE